MILENPYCGNEAAITPEYRGSTHDTASMLRELEKEALDRIVRRLSIVNNAFNCEVLIERDLSLNRIVARCFVRLNGAVIDLECPINEGTSDHEAVDIVVKAVAEKLAAEIIASTLGVSLAQARVFR